MHVCKIRWRNASTPLISKPRQAFAGCRSISSNCRCIISAIFSIMSDSVLIACASGKALESDGSEKARHEQQCADCYQLWPPCSYSLRYGGDGLPERLDETDIHWQIQTSAIVANAYIFLDVIVVFSVLYHLGIARSSCRRTMERDRRPMLQWPVRDCAE